MRDVDRTQSSLWKGLYELSDQHVDDEHTQLKLLFIEQIKNVAHCVRVLEEVRELLNDVIYFVSLKVRKEVASVFGGYLHSSIKNVLSIYSLLQGADLVVLVSKVASAWENHGDGLVAVVNEAVLLQSP